MNSKSVKILIILLLMTYLVVSLGTLTFFPFVHSDETWLANLSEAMLESNTLKTTEPAFDLYPRSPHALRILFNLLQMMVIRLFGNQITALRMISWLFAMASGALMGRVVYKLTESRSIALAVMIGILVNIQFIYLSHFARQEAILFFLLALNLYYLTRPAPSPVLSGVVSGLAIGVHPNSFIIFLPILVHWLYTRSWRKVLAYLTTVTAFAAAFVAFSLALDPDFITHYLGYGATLGVEASLWDKIAQWPVFYLKLFYGVSGTYYTPDIRVYFILVPMIVITTAVLSLKRKVGSRGLSMLLAVNLGYILIGRYNQTSIIFCLPILALITAQLLAISGKRTRQVLIAFFLLISLVNTSSNMLVHPQSESYGDYIAGIEALVPDGPAVLGNLNTLEAFDASRVYDYRNLAFLETSFTEYIEDRQIEYILYPEEMDFIYQNRPLWNALYGNLYPYYDEMHHFLETSCERIGTLESPIYAMRIVRYIESQPFTLKIYKVK